MTKLLAILKTNKPARNTGKSQVKKTQKALQTHSVNKITTACIILIQKKKPLTTQKMYKSNTSQHKLKGQQKATKRLRQQS